MLKLDAKQIRQVERVDLPPNLTKLQRAIYEAAAPILHEYDVRKYQESARKRLAVRFWFKRLAGISAFLLGAAGGLFYYAWRLLLSRGSSALDIAFSLIVAAAMGYCGALCVLMVAGPFLGKGHLAKWSVLPISAFPPGQIPFEVGMRAGTIRQWCPNAQLSVEYLGEDPFLIAQDGGERYYVAVWDEEGFIQ